MKKNNKGFTLIELIIVVVIIGILISAIIGLNNFKEMARLGLVKTQSLEIKKTIDSRMRDNGAIYYFQYIPPTAGWKDNKDTVLDSLNSKNFPTNPWGYEWYWRGVNDTTTYSDSLEIRTIIPEGHCDTISTSLKNQRSKINCENISRPFPNTFKFKQIIITYQAE